MTTAMVRHGARALGEVSEDMRAKAREMETYARENPLGAIIGGVLALGVVSGGGYWWWTVGRYKAARTYKGVAYTVAPDPSATGLFPKLWTWQATSVTPNAPPLGGGNGFASAALADAAAKTWIDAHAIVG